MGTIYSFRGKAATGKTVLSNRLAKALSIPVIRKDDILDALKTTAGIDQRLVTNQVCYNILREIIQTNLDLEADFILDIGLGDRNHARFFHDRLNWGENGWVGFFMDCSDEEQWRRRHEERLASPLPNQTFESLEHVLRHYEQADIHPLEGEHVIDSARPPEECFHTVMATVRRIQRQA